MERTYSYEEANRLRREHHSLLAQLRSVEAEPERLRAAVMEQTRALGSDREWVTLVERDLLSVADAEKNALFRKLLRVLYSYTLAQPVADSCRALLARHSKAIERDLATLSPAESRLKWLLSGARSRLSCRDAFTRLAALQSGGYAAEAADALRAIGQIQNVTDEVAKAAWEREPSSLLQALTSCRDGDDADAIPCVSALTDIYTPVKERLEKVRSAVDSAKKRVLTAAQRRAAEQTIEELKKIPVEELNRSKQGIRVKLLRDSGFETIAHVYTASDQDLAAVRGISEETAGTIRELAREIAMSTRRGVKLQLSADERTAASTELLSALHAYRGAHEAEPALSSLEERWRAEIDEPLALLAEKNDSISWFFQNAEDRSAVRNAYRALSDIRPATGENELLALESHISAIDLTQDAAAVWADFSENASDTIALLETLTPELLGGEEAAYGLPEALARDVQDEAVFPNGLLCTLRRYQEWGVKYILHQEKVLLGDEMGLGKTVQAIAAMVSLKNTGATHFVVVCPASVLANWRREVPQHSRLRVTQIYGPDRERALASWIEAGGVAVTTYETTEHFLLDDDFRFSMLVVDEAHYIKNPNTKRTKNVKALCEHADRLLFMTGTALENRTDEMIALVRLLQPDVARRLRAVSYLNGAPQFREIASSVYYRRRREDVLTELPELIESREWCRMTPQEEKVYEDAVRGKNYTESRRVSWNVDDLAYSSKAQRLLELVEEASDDGRKILVFTYFLDTAQRVRELLGDRCMDPINGSVPPQRRQEIVDEFEAAPAGSVLVAQIQAGGTGLNIQSASVVILCEPQFKPSTENQAISRAYRMGQTRSVLVYRLLCEDSVDERICELLEQKQEIFDAFADTSAAADESLELDKKTFGNILQEEIDRINAKYAAAP